MTDLALARRDPAASAYGDLMRARRSGVDPIAREAERVRTLMAACGTGLVAARDAKDREVRRAFMQGFRL